MEFNTEEHRNRQITLRKILHCGHFRFLQPVSPRCTSVFSVLNILEEINAAEFKKI